MSSVAQRLLTAEEFWQLPGDGKHTELVRGEVVKAMPPGIRHGAIAVKIAMLLGFWAQKANSGSVIVEGGYLLGRDPDVLRAPDVSYAKIARIPADGLPEGFWSITPDLAVEVVSPNETAYEVQEKVSDFLKAGTPLVWVVYPRRDEVVVYTADGLARTYTGDDVLEQPDVLPGFTCLASEMFA